MSTQGEEALKRAMRKGKLECRSRKGYNLGASEVRNLFGAKGEDDDLL